VFLSETWCHITQLSAVSKSGTFTRYVKPKMPIPTEVTLLTGLSFERGQMFLRGELVESVSLKECLQAFWEFLGDGFCILVAHNCNTFDSRVLYRAVRSADALKQLSTHVVGFLDTLPLFRTKYPLVENHQQATLVYHFLNISYEEHNAAHDAHNLKRLLQHCAFDWESKQSHTFRLDYVKDILAFLEQKKENMVTLWPLVYDRVLSKSMAEKIAASGLKEMDLESAFEQEGRMGISALFNQPRLDGKARVTKLNRIIDSICNYYN